MTTLKTSFDFSSALQQRGGGECEFYYLFIFSQFDLFIHYYYFFVIINNNHVKMNRLTGNDFI